MVTTPSLDGYSAEDMKDWIIPQTINRLHELADRRDVEMGHYEADGILCDLLKTLGYAEVVAAWEKVERWYA